MAGGRGGPRPLLASSVVPIALFLVSPEVGGGRGYSELGILEVRFPSPLHDLSLRQSATVEEWNSSPSILVRVYPLVKRGRPSLVRLSDE